MTKSQQEQRTESARISARRHFRTAAWSIGTVMVAVIASILVFGWLYDSMAELREITSAGATGLALLVFSAPLLVAAATFVAVAAIGVWLACRDDLRHL